MYLKLVLVLVLSVLTVLVLDMVVVVVFGLVAGVFMSYLAFGRLCFPFSYQHFSISKHN